MVYLLSIILILQTHLIGLVHDLHNRNTLSLESFGRAHRSSLQILLKTSTRIEKIALLRAAYGATNNWSLIPFLVRLSQTPDRTIALEAAVLGAELSTQLDSQTLQQWEIPSHHVQEWYQSWLTTAQSTKRWNDIRIYSLSAAYKLYALNSASSEQQFPWDSFISDPDNSIRSAALELMPHTSLKAGQWLCGPFGSPSILSPQQRADRITKKIQVLAMNDTLDIQSRIDLVSCLSSDNKENQHIVNDLSRQSTALTTWLKSNE